MTSITLQENPYGTRRRVADWVLAAAAVLAFVETLLNYFFDVGIAYSGGALLVVVSTLLIIVALAAVRWWASIPGWLMVVFAILTVLDFIGTAFAGYLLESYLLVVLMVIAFVAWLFAVSMRPRFMKRAP